MSLTDYQYEAVMEENHQTAYELLMETYNNALAPFDEDDPDGAKALEIAENFKRETETLEYAIEKRKAWLDRHRDLIAGESEKYGRDGHNGLSFSVAHKTTYKYDAIPEWSDYQRALKKVEEKAKLGLKMVQAGTPTPMDGETGEVLPVANFTTTAYLKTTKIK